MFHKLRPSTWNCINCGSVQARYVCSYWYGVNEVGPFCEACDGLIKNHTKFRRAESWAAQLVDTARFLRRCRGSEPAEYFEAHAIECERLANELVR